MRRAESSPFHTLDSHIKNHRPPIVMNPSAQSSNPSQRQCLRNKLLINLGVPDGI